MSEPLHARRTEVESRAVHGYFEGVIDGAATGWCWRPADPSERLEVEVRVDGVAVGRSRADQRRDSVERAGHGDGRYGFRVGLPESLADGASHEIAVLVDGTPLPPADGFAPGVERRGGGTNVVGGDGWSGTKFLPPSAAPEFVAKRRFSRRRRGSAADPAPPTEVHGYVDGIQEQELFGWVVDPARPDRSLAVELLFDGDLVGAAHADLPRDDLARAGYGEDHGFRFSLTRELAPGRYLVEVRTVEGGLRVPLAKDYVVVGADGEQIDEVRLIDASPDAPPLALSQPTEALLGTDRWLFAWPGNTQLELLRGAEALPPSALDSHLTRIRMRHRLARDAGAILVEAVLPAKLAVCREHLPAGLGVDEAGRPVEQLEALVAEENDIDVLDLTPALRQARSHGEVFARTGRELTWPGAFAAYRVIAKRLAMRTEITPMRREALKLMMLEPIAATLAHLPRLVAIGADLHPAGVAADDEELEGEPRLDWSCLSTEYAVLDDELYEVAGQLASMLRRREEGSGTSARGTSALVIHDGSASRIAPFIAEHFSRTLIVGAGAEIAKVVERLAPAAMIEVVEESTLLHD